MIGNFFLKAPATTEIYTLSLHDALPIFLGESADPRLPRGGAAAAPAAALALAGASRPLLWERRRVHVRLPEWRRDRKSTRLNSSHANISYAVFCLKKKHE